MTTLPLILIIAAAVLAAVEWVRKLRRDERRRAIESRLEQICR